MGASKKRKKTSAAVAKNQLFFHYSLDLVRFDAATEVETGEIKSKLAAPEASTPLTD